MDQYQPYTDEFSSDPISVFTSLLSSQLFTPNPIAVTTDPAPVGFDQNISSISIGSTVYRVVTVTTVFILFSFMIFFLFSFPFLFLFSFLTTMSAFRGIL